MLGCNCVTNLYKFPPKTVYLTVRYYYQIYPLLSTCSRRSMRRKVTRMGKDFIWFPSNRLLNSLVKKTGFSREYLKNQLMVERDYLLRE